MDSSNDNHGEGMDDDEEGVNDSNHGKASMSKDPPGGTTHRDAEVIVPDSSRRTHQDHKQATKLEAKEAENSLHQTREDTFVVGSASLSPHPARPTKGRTRKAGLRHNSPPTRRAAAAAAAAQTTANPTMNLHSDVMVGERQVFRHDAGLLETTSPIHTLNSSQQRASYQDTLVEARLVEEPSLVIADPILPESNRNSNSNYAVASHNKWRYVAGVSVAVALILVAVLVATLARSGETTEPMALPLEAESTNMTSPPLVPTAPPPSSMIPSTLVTSSIPSVAPSSVPSNETPIIPSATLSLAPSNQSSWLPSLNPSMAPTNEPFVPLVKNDLCEDAIEIDLSSEEEDNVEVRIVGTIVGATADNNSPACPYDLWDYPGVWYKIPSSHRIVGPITVDLCGLQWGEGPISVYSGSCSNLNCIGGQDVYCDNERAFVFSADGRILDYYIRVYPYDDVNETTFELVIGRA
jgi:hypothetical protein